MKIYTFLFFFLIFFSFTKSSFSEKVSIVYTVNNDPITSIEMKNEITYLKLINRDLNNMDNKSLVIYASKSILREKIKELEIKKYFKIGMNDEAVTQSLVKLLTTLGLENLNEFNNLLSELKLEIEFVKNKIEIELLWNQLIFEKYKNKLSINENKIKKDLKAKIKNEKNEINEYNLSEILFTPKFTELIFEKGTIVNVNSNSSSGLMSLSL